MRLQQFIRPAHIWTLTVLVACGLWVVAGKAGISIQGQQNSNPNQNQNSNSNTNTNTNTNTGQNRNANTTGNRNTENTRASGEQAGMANMSSQDRKFIMDAAMGGMMEVELGRIAAQQGASESVKQFGQRMVDDHGKANTELMTLASSKGITLPKALDEKHQQHVTKLSGLSGAEFDRAYAKMMARDHRDDVSDFEKQSLKGADPDLKAFAGKTLPILQEHLKMARALEDEHGGGNSNRNSNSNSNKNSNRNSNDNSNRP